jgi:predicted class III extradiol MEMO1 family dioxygenase
MKTQNEIYQWAKDFDELSSDFDHYEYMNNVSDRDENIAEIANDISLGNTETYKEILQDFFIADDDPEFQQRARELLDRLNTVDIESK